jgi:competence protein ComEC
VPDLHISDEVQVVGRLSRLAPASNPGEFDTADYWRSQGVLTQVTVRHSAAGVTRLIRGWPASFRGWLAVGRRWGQDALKQAIPERTSPVAMALLLGEGAPMSADDWAKYVRTGVIHVLAISGQHLVVLAMFLWGLLRLLGVRQRRGAVFVALVLLGYALLTGGRPPALRAAVMVCAACGALILRRRTLPANLFALAWLTVALLNPTDLFDQGCQLSFLSVAVLYWGTSWLSREEDDPLAQVIEETHPAVQRGLRTLAWFVLESYLVAALIWVAIVPLVAFRTHTIPVMVLLIGPPLTLLASIALLAGFAVLALAVIHPALATYPGYVVHWSLYSCEWLVDLTDRWHTHIYVPDLSEGWLWIGYLALLGVLTHRASQANWRWVLLGGLGWLCLALLPAVIRTGSDEFRCTFLAVGHGGCAVLETPDGQTLLYDAGAMNGPDVTKRQIAPFLWRRGIRRIDEVILSHADLDHFNGLPALLDRFTVGQVTCTPTFADKQTPAVKYTLAELERCKVPVRIVKAGDRLSAGAVTLEVLHPPIQGPEGNENTRSLVLRVSHAGHVLLLTGDLEGEGLERVVRQRAEPVDVLMAPHHGSHRVDGKRLSDWCRPRLVVACQGMVQGPARAPALYTRRGAPFWTTFEHGAITVRSHTSGMVVETFLTRQRVVLRTRASKP